MPHHQFQSTGPFHARGNGSFAGLFEEKSIDEESFEEKSFEEDFFEEKSFNGSKIKDFVTDLEMNFSFLSNQS